MAEVEFTEQVICGRYRVLSKLGEGAMGAVYLAGDLQLPRQVALKVLRKEWVSRPDVKQRLETECGLMARLGSSMHIVTLYDRLEYEGDVVLVMEFVPGETLADICDRTRTLDNDVESSRKTAPVSAGSSIMVLTERDAVQVVCQCLEGLGFAHSKGIIHRDIKPSNIIVARDHNGNISAKIMDFGIGKALQGGEGDSTNPMLTGFGGPGPGTPAYMAPEQIDTLRFGHIGPAADLYAVGVTLYELLTLRRPFEGTYTELLQAHTNVEPIDPVKIRQGLSPALSPIVLKSLRKVPAERYPSAAEFKYDLENAALGAAVPGEAPRQRKNLLPLAFAGIAVALVMAVTGVFVFGKTVTPDDAASHAGGAATPAVSSKPEPPVPATPVSVPAEEPKPAPAAPEAKPEAKPEGEAAPVAAPTQAIPPPSQPLVVLYDPQAPRTQYYQGEEFSFSLKIEGAKDPGKLSVTANVPDGGAFDPATNRFSWNGNGKEGQNEVVFAIQDGSVSPPSTKEQKFAFAVVPKPPEPPVAAPPAPTPPVTPPPPVAPVAAAPVAAAAAPPTAAPPKQRVQPQQNIPAKTPVKQPASAQQPEPAPKKDNPPAAGGSSWLNDVKPVSQTVKQK